MNILRSQLATLATALLVIGCASDGPRTDSLPAAGATARQAAPPAATPAPAPRPAPQRIEAAPPAPALPVDDTGLAVGQSAVASQAPEVLRVQVPAAGAANAGSTQDYQVMIGPYAGQASAGFVEQVPWATAGDPNFNGSAWQVTGGFARIFGWFPMGTTNHVVAGGIGTSFVVQIDGAVHRVFLVDRVPGDTVEVRPRGTTQGSTTVISSENDYVEVANGTLAVKKLSDLPRQHPIRDFLAAVAQQAATVSQP